MEPPQSPDDVVIELLRKEHVTKDFSCGDEFLDVYLKRYAYKNARNGHGAQYVAVRPGTLQVWGFYTLSAGSIDIKQMISPTGCPSHVSVALLGRVGVALALQRKGFGVTLVSHALERAAFASQIIGIHGVLLHAKTPDLIDYYLKFGFASLPDDNKAMFLAMKTIKDGLGQ